ncbi:MAG TPA: TonB-dependent receptor, partial [Bacteroidales bacterium]|nr:TonB-dependent receptor [Bacteroidales bacterium]
MKFSLKLVFTMLLTMALFANSFAQTTTSGINGRITDEKGQPLSGANVVAVDEPTGSQYGTITDEKGFYTLANMNVGGPYTVTITFVGYEKLVKNNVYLTLGQTYRLSGTLKEASQKLEEVSVSAKKVKDAQVFDANRTGAQTVVNSEQITMMPSISGDLNDFTRLVPQANVIGEGISIAGMNNRYNSVFIDGTINNDVFGLAANGMNGGQTGISAISYEAIDQFQIVLAPYDVRESGFAGAGINAVTRSGTNTFKGMAYYKFRNQNLAGKTPTDDESVSREKLPEFTAKTYGINLGGPVVKNKLFFFLNGEIQHDQTPQPFNFNDYIGNSSKDELNAIAQHMIDMGYNPGGYLNNTSELNGKKLLARIDWNISPKHKLMIRNQYTYGESVGPYSSNSKNINFYNSGVYFPSTTNAFAAELKSRFSNEFSNILKIGYTYVHDDRNVMGSDFPGITINDGAGTIHAGGEIYSSGNELKQNIMTVTDNVQLFKGRHTITIGTHNEFYHIYNLFMRRAFGDYTFASPDMFLKDSAYFYRIGYSMVDNVRGDGSKAAADFRAMQLGGYIQDEFQATENLKLTLGLRLDVPVFNDQPKAISGFNDTTINKLSQYYDLEGARAGHMPSAQFLFSPRFGFNFDVFGDESTQIRGGIGIFTSRVPFVWPAGSYTNNGMMVGDYTIQDYNKNPIVKFNPDVNSQPTGPVGVPSGSQIDLYADNFKFPQMLRGDIGIDQK